MDQQRIAEYAKLIVKMGLRPVPGQEVMIMAGLDQIEFVRMVVEMCYQEGASKVQVDWQDMPLEKLHNIYQSEERLGSIENWEVEKLRWQADKLPARLVILSEDPDGMAGIDQGKRARAQAKRYPLIKPFRDAMENRYQWCIAAVPGIQWARKVFPGLPDADAVEKLWDAILSASRAKGDPIGNWQRHNAEIHRRAELLNSYRFTALEYHSGNGTDFRVGLMNELEKLKGLRYREFSFPLALKQLLAYHEVRSLCKSRYKPGQP